MAALLNGLGGAAGFGESTLGETDDGFLVVDLANTFGPGGLGFLGVRYSHLTVSNNGNITFGTSSSPTGVSYAPTPLQNAGTALIAAYWADVDTRAGAQPAFDPSGNSTGSNLVWVDQNAELEILTVTWDDVAGFSQGTTHLNAFQLQMIGTGGGNFDLVLRYESINWASAVVPRAGFSDGATAAGTYELPGSGNSASMLDLESAIGSESLGLFRYRLWTGGPGSEQFVGINLNNIAFGGGGDDNLTGGAGSDTLQGEAGDDTLAGGPGNDLLDGGSDSDTASYAGASDAMVVSLVGSSGFAQGVDGFDTLLHIENIIGTQFSDTLTGNASANRIFGLGGDDLLTGLGGDDLLDGGEGNDTASYTNASASVQISLLPGAANSGADGADTLVSIENLHGSIFDDTLTGDDNANIISGYEGDDLILGGGGDDAVYADPGSDTVSGDAGNDSLDGGDGDDLLYGGDDNDYLNYFDRFTTGNDTLIGGQGSDTLFSYDGADFLDGGAGDDYYQLGPSAFDTTISDPSGYDTVYAFLNGYSLGTGLEQLDFQSGMTGGSGNDDNNTLNGNELGNTMGGQGGNDDIFGYDGADIIDGGTGADYLSGGRGDDTYFVDDINDQVVEDDSDGDDQPDGVDLGGGIDLVIASVNFTLGQNLNNLTLTGDTQGQVGFGNALRNILSANLAGAAMFGEEGNDTLIGDAGDDTLEGGAGADRLIGLGGADLFAVGRFGMDLTLSTVAAPDVIVDFSFAAGDRLQTLTNNGMVLGKPLVWRGDATTSGLIAGIGSVAPGADLGPDLLQMWMFHDAVNFVTGLYIDTDSNFIVDAQDFLLTFPGDARPGLGPDSLSPDTFATTFAASGQGTEGNDVLAGGSANNTINGLGGQDSLVGATGDDTLIGGAGHDTLVGGMGNDLLIGDADNDRLVGGAGNDTLQGGAGNDLLLAAEDGAEGAALDSSSAINSIDGGEGNDTVYGGAGADNLHGGANDDLLSYAYAAAAVNVNLQAGTAVGGAGNDTVTGFEQLIGSAFADTLAGTTGDDRLEGGAGADILTGRNGADLFWIQDYTVFDSQGASTRVLASPVSAPDRITDFDSAAGDRLMLYGANWSGPLVWRGDAHGSDFTGVASGGTTGFSAAPGQALGGRDVEHPVTQLWMFFDTGTGRTTLFMDADRDFVVDPEDLRVDFDGDVRARLGVDAFAPALGVRSMGTGGDDQINGNASGNLLLGGDGNDQLYGLEDNDTLIGGAGNDSLHGAAGVDDLQGGSGFDLLEGGGDNYDTLRGGDGNDTLDGGLGQDYLYAGPGDDRVYFDGNDLYVFGDDGFDTLVIADGLALSLIRLGTPFAQILQGASNAAQVYYFEGLDFSTRSAGVNFLAESNSDTITGTRYNDTIDGAGGHDSLSGGLGFDSLNGGIGNDTLRGAENADTLIGGDGDDSLAGGKGVDFIDGGEGNDTLSGGVGPDTLIGGNGIDRADYSLAIDAVSVNLTIVGLAQFVSVGQGSDMLSSVEHVTGGNLPDALVGDQHANYLIGLNGNDTLIGNEGFDTLDGGEGNDLLAGGNNADSLLGGPGNDTVGGGKGMDTIDGGDGNDLLNGTLGLDRLTGGTGADVFLFNSLLDGVTNIDTITDFTRGVDLIQLSAAIFTAFSGRVGQFVSPDAHLGYNTTTGVLTYDPDAGGAGLPLTFAILGTQSHPATLGVDFQIVA